MNDKASGSNDGWMRWFSNARRWRPPKAFLVYVAATGVAAWGFLTGRGYILLVLGVLAWFVLLTAGLSSLLSWFAQGPVSGSKRRSAARKPLMFAALFAVALLAGVIVSFTKESAPATSAMTRPTQALGIPRGGQFRNVVYAWRGIRMRLATAADATRSEEPRAAGMVVEHIGAGSPAAATKLRPGDIITALDRMPTDTARGLALAIADRPPGPTVRLAVQSDDRQQLIAMSLAASTGRALAMRPVERQPAG
jgi:membrane-associated protease RseP (regulator of RpoE activity)